MFAGHFPGNAIVPGVILVEALAQTAGIAAATGYEESARPLFLLSAIRSMKFLRPVRPGEELRLWAHKMGEVDDLVQFKVEAACDNVNVAEGQIVLNKIEAARVPVL